MRSTGFGRRVLEPQRPRARSDTRQAVPGSVRRRRFASLNELKERIRTALMSRIDPTVAGRIPRADPARRSRQAGQRDRDRGTGPAQRTRGDARSPPS